MEAKNDQNRGFWVFWTVILAKLATKWFNILILFTKTNLLVPKPSLYYMTLRWKFMIKTILVVKILGPSWYFIFR